MAILFLRLVLGIIGLVFLYLSEHKFYNEMDYKSMIKFHYKKIAGGKYINKYLCTEILN